MDSIVYRDAEYFSNIINDLVEEGESFHIVGDYYVINDILLYLLINEDMYTMGSVVLLNPDDSEYDKEFCMSIDCDGYIKIFPAFLDNQYMEFDEEDLVLIFEDSNSKIVSKNKNAIFVEVRYCCGQCEDCHCQDELKTEFTHDKYGELTGYVKTKETDNTYYRESFYSNDPKIVQFHLNR